MYSGSVRDGSGGSSAPLDFENRIIQGHLQKWTEHLRVFFLNLKPLEISSPKFQHLYNYSRNEFSPNLEGVAQKIGLPQPFEFLNVFGWKSIFWHLEPSYLVKSGFL